MNQSLLEGYLNRLDKCLGAVVLSEKAEIILEIKSHLMEAQEKNPDKSFDQLLQELGEPEIVANRYLTERGLETHKPPKHPVVKWLVIGFLGTFAMAMMTLLIVLWKFTPLVEVNEEEGIVKVLGGTISVSESKGKTALKIKKELDQKQEVEKVTEVQEVAPHIKQIAMNFSNIKASFLTSEGSEIEYQCDTAGPIEITEVRDTLNYDFSKALGASCEFSIPRDLIVNVEASNASFDFKNISWHLKLKAANGKIKFTPDQDLNYFYQLELVNGSSSRFKSSSDPDAYRIEMQISNGLIQR